jgi:hypothetical protein
MRPGSVLIGAMNAATYVAPSLLLPCISDTDEHNRPSFLPLLPG